jgi:hypothetical protein
LLEKLRSKTVFLRTKIRHENIGDVVVERKFDSPVVDADPVDLQRAADARYGGGVVFNFLLASPGD